MMRSSHVPHLPLGTQPFEIPYFRGVAGSRLRHNGNKRRHELNTSNMRSVDIILHTPPLPNPIVPQIPKTLSYQYLTNCHVLGLVGGGPKPPPHLNHFTPCQSCVGLGRAMAGTSP